MARIRSLHPGQALDEDFVEMSRDARLFTLHLRCEADDQGVFEWKAKRLKMAIFPADDDVDVDAILAELVENRQVQQFEVEGKRYGIIRNFRRWQRPKKPTSNHPLPEHLRNYSGLIDGDFPTGSEPKGDEENGVPNQFPTGSEKSSQMKEEGGRREEKEEPAGSSKKSRKTASANRGSRVDGFEPDVAWAIGAGLSAERAGVSAERFLDHWRGISGQRGVKLDWPATWRNWVRNDLEKAGGAASHPAQKPTGELSDDDWRKRLEHARRTRNWSTTRWGPFPGHPGCTVPPALIEPGDGEGWEDKGLAAATAPSRQFTAA